MRILAKHIILSARVRWNEKRQVSQENNLNDGRRKKCISLITKIKRNLVETRKFLKGKAF